MNTFKINGKLDKEYSKRYFLIDEEGDPITFELETLEEAKTLREKIRKPVNISIGWTENTLEFYDTDILDYDGATPRDWCAFCNGTILVEE